MNITTQIDQDLQQNKEAVARIQKLASIRLSATPKEETNEIR